MSTAERITALGDYMTIDVEGLADEVKESIRSHMRGMNQMTADEWTEWSALADEQAKCDWLDRKAAA